jgi:hypothetical protein
MACSLSKYIKETKTHYVSKDGKEYLYDEYCNWGIGEGYVYKNKKDLPLDGYPYSIKYKTEHLFKVCRECKCEK